MRRARHEGQHRKGSVMTKSWSADRVTKLRDMHRRGVTEANMAGELGVTRGSVAGKLSRLGMAAPGKRRNKPTAETGPHQPVSIRELEPEHCRFALDRRDTRPGLGYGLRMYCGGHRLPHGSYCMKHWRLARAAS